MAHYIFNAIPTDESTKLCNQMIESCKNTARMEILRNTYASGLGKAVMRSIGRGALKSVKDGDTVYVLMHGAGHGGSQFVGMKRGAELKNSGVAGRPTWQGGDWKMYNATQLARAIKKEGLPQGFRDLHLATCGSGLAGYEMRDPNSPGPVPLDAMFPLAKRLKDCLVAEGFAAIMVTGYKGDVLTNICRNNWFAVERENANGRDEIVAAALATVVF